jgi:predicted S18 family serine protease
MGRRRYRRNLFLSALLGLVIGLAAGLAVGMGLAHLSLSGPGATPTTQPSPLLSELYEWVENSGRTVNILAVASGENTFGVVCTLGVKVSQGSGGVYVDIDPTLVGFDFQGACRTAVRIACQKAGLQPDEDNVGVKGMDLFFRVVGPGEEVTVQAVDGPSAGAATTIAVLAALENKQIRPGVVITGTIEEDGSIGQVGGVYYKAEAAAKKGAKLMLVPKDQSKVLMWKPVTRQIGWWTWTTYEPVEIDLNQWSENQGWGLEIREVSTIDEVINLMLE